MQNRIFSDEQEEIIADFIRTQFIKPGVMVRRRHLQKVLYMLWQSFNLDNRKRHRNKIFSRTFVKLFCKRNNFSFLHMRKKREAK